MSTRIVFFGSDGFSDPYFKFTIIRIDLPKELPTQQFEAAEVMFAVRVVILREFIEGDDALAHPP